MGLSGFQTGPGHLRQVRNELGRNRQRLDERRLPQEKSSRRADLTPIMYCMVLYNIAYYDMSIIKQYGILNWSYL